MRVTPTVVRAAEAMLRGALEPMLATRNEQSQIPTARQVGPCEATWPMRSNMAHLLDAPLQTTWRRVCSSACIEVARLRGSSAFVLLS